MATIDDYGALKDAIASFGTFDQEASVPYFVDWAAQEIGRRLRARVMLVRDDITIDDEYVDLPADFEAAKSLTLPDVSPRRTLTFVSPEVVEDRIVQGATQSYPEVVAIEGDQFHFGPAFTAEPTGSLLYYATPEGFTDDSDTNAVLVKYPFLYLWGSLEALYRFMEDDTQADRYGGLFGALLADINAQEAKDVLSGPIQVQNAPGRIV